MLPVLCVGCAADGGEEYKLYVGMISRQSTEDDIRKLFEPYGVLKEVHILRQNDAKQSSKGNSGSSHPLSCRWAGL